MNVDSYYTVLGVAENGSPEEIKAAYRELVRQVHPDSIATASPYWKRAAEDKTKEVNEAYAVLADAGKRREYDRLLARRRQASPPAPVKPTPSPSHASAAQAPSYCPQCGAGQYADGYCPGCRNSTRTQAGPAAGPRPQRQSQALRRKDIGELVLALCCGFVVVGGLAGLFRAVWAPLLCSIALAGLLRVRNTLRISRLYRWLAAAALAVSVCFVVSDLAQPPQASPPPLSQASIPDPGEPVKAETTAGDSTDRRVEPPDVQPPADPGPPDLSGLTFDEKQSIEAVCGQDVPVPLAYNRCLVRQLTSWKAGPGRPDLSPLTRDDRLSIEAVCASAKFTKGPAAYNRCLIRQLERSKTGVKRPDLSALAADDRQSIENRCANAKYIEGPAAYNACLIQRLQSLGSNHP
jgi:hypothetical protein